MNTSIQVSGLILTGLLLLEAMRRLHPAGMDGIHYAQLGWLVALVLSGTVWLWAAIISLTGSKDKGEKKP